VKGTFTTEEIDLAAKYDATICKRDRSITHDTSITLRSSIFPDYLCCRFAAEWRLI
jgi:hypothetical protein